MVEWWSAGLTKAGARLKALARFTCPNGVLSPISGDAMFFGTCVMLNTVLFRLRTFVGDPGDRQHLSGVLVYFVTRTGVLWTSRDGSKSNAMIGGIDPTNIGFLDSFSIAAITSLTSFVFKIRYATLSVEATPL